MKLRFKLPLVPALVVKAAEHMEGAAVGPSVEFDLTVSEPHTRDGMIAYMATFGAVWVADEPQGDPGVVP